MAQSGTIPKQLIRNDYSSTNVTTSAYVELDAALDGHTNEIEIFDSGGETMLLALGPVGSESDIMYIIPGGNGRIKLGLPQGARLSVKAVSGNVTTGELTMNLWG
jgi:hypothetical protein